MQKTSTELVPFSKLDRRLDVCIIQDCGSRLVQATYLGEVGLRYARIHLWCPECDNQEEDVFSAIQLSRLNEAIKQGKEELLAFQDEMITEHMTEEVGFFVRCLEADIIIPSDF